jgi:imidazoleglycerol-phosphate dehydratase
MLLQSPKDSNKLMKNSAKFKRETLETKIDGSIDLKGSGKGTIQTGIGFLDHMLELFKFHAGFDLELKVDGDLHVCPHHTIEDVALTLGSAFQDALQDKKGINRYATCYLPMDESLTRTVIDVSGRSYHRFQGTFKTENVGQFPTEMVIHFFQSFSSAAKITLHQEILYGDNDHHKIESLFKGFARAIHQAISKRVGFEALPSTKGML